MTCSSTCSRSLSRVLRPFLNPWADDALTQSLASRFAAGTTTSSHRAQQRGYSSHAPMDPRSLPERKKVTITKLRSMYKAGTPITMVTAHDFPSGLVADQAGADMILVGDSLAMVALGMDDTNQITLTEMIHHARAVARGAKSAFLVGDLPMGSYELSPHQSITSAISMISHGRMSAVKLEGGAAMAPHIRAITAQAGIPVLAHVGLTPQRSHSLGGFRVQGKTARGAERVLDDALAVQEAGAFGVVLEAVPAEVAELVTGRLEIPTIGIGAGSGTSGQVLVQVDMLGNFPEGRFMPKFVKTYESLYDRSLKAIQQYREEVRSRAYPAQEHTYPISAQELDDFKEIVQEREAEIEEAREEKRREFE